MHRPASSLSNGQVYQDASPFNTPVPANPQLAPNSSQIVHRVTSWGPPAKPYAGAAGTSDDWSHPVYFARWSDPVYRIHQTGWANPDIEGQRIHIPVGAKPAGGGDASFSVVGPFRGWEYDFWDAKTPSGHGGTFTANFGKRGLWRRGRWPRDEPVPVSRRNHRRRVLESGGCDPGRRRWSRARSTTRCS